MADISVKGNLQLSPISINEDYAKKWNETSKDFVMLTKNGQLVSENLYRVGGLGADITKDYFMLLKYVEAHYSKEIMQMSKSKDDRHLEGRWVIIDKYGVEKIEFEKYEHGWIISDSCIYSLNGNYYNIETKEFYGNASVCIKSTNFIFLENNYDKDESKRGVMKINKKDGSWELFV